MGMLGSGFAGILLYVAGFGEIAQYLFGIVVITIIYLAALGLKSATTLVTEWMILKILGKSREELLKEISAISTADAVLMAAIIFCTMTAIGMPRATFTGLAAALAAMDFLMYRLKDYEYSETIGIAILSNVLVVAILNSVLTLGMALIFGIFGILAYDRAAKIKDGKLRKFALWSPVVTLALVVIVVFNGSQKWVKSVIELLMYGKTL